jgi:hypothetical protein
VTIAQLKLVVAAIGIGLFGAGVRFGHPYLRWVGIGCVAAAFALRFVRPRRNPVEPAG